MDERRPAVSAQPAGRYDNLIAVGGGLRGYGAVLKAMGGFAFFGGILFAFILGLGGNGGGALAAGAVAFLGVVLYTTGMLVAAMGEALKALADIAINTAITAARAKAEGVSGATP